jgi:N-acyl-D-aspartate/D-glutamate deacylase
MLDLLLTGGTVIDGTGARGRRMDVGLRGGRVAAVGEVPEPARETLDVIGKVLAPGFIDMHSHTDHYLLVNPDAESKITQGITTEVCGNCGFSPGPLLHETVLSQSRTTLARYGLEPQWRTLGEFLDHMERQPLGVNFVTLVGHGNLRASVMGCDNRPPTAAELDRMQGLLADELDAGAFGYSSGLIYPPGCYSETEELAALGTVLARCGGFYATHMRNESHAVVEAVEEALRVGREGGCPVQISHHKACGRSNWGKVETTLAMIDRARAEGVDVHMDQYPYVATSTGLGTVLPRWAHEGGLAATVARLRDPETRAQILEHVREAGSTGYVADSGGWRQLVIAGVPTVDNRWVEGLDLEQVAARMGCEPAEAALRLLDEEEMAVSIVHFTISEEDVERVMTHPLTMIGSDGSARATKGPLFIGKPHPRTYGSFPRVLGHYVRERKLLSLEEAIHKMTGLTAAKVGLADRGVIREGAAADLVVFDPETVRDRATFTDPHQNSVGIDYVFVNGVPAVERGEVTGRHGGHVLRRR